MTNRLAVGLIVGIIMVVVSAAVLWPGSAATELSASQNVQGLSLLTDTPEEGFALAVTLSRRAVSTTQPDTDVLRALRPEYSQDADALIAVSHVVAVHFQTVAAANDYWRE